MWRTDGKWGVHVAERPMLFDASCIPVNNVLIRSPQRDCFLVGDVFVVAFALMFHEVWTLHFGMSLVDRPILEIGLIFVGIFMPDPRPWEESTNLSNGPSDQGEWIQLLIERCFLISLVYIEQ